MNGRHHRLLLLTHLPPPISPSTILAELAFISTSLLPDAKNYHTWAYRQFVLTHFAAILSPQNWADEQRWLDTLLKVDEASMLSEEDVPEEDKEGEDEWDEVVEGEEKKEDDGHVGDVRNNSAWGHRWFLNFGRVGLEEEDRQAAIEREIKWVWLPFIFCQAYPRVGKAHRSFFCRYTLAQITLVPNNASSWAYLRGYVSIPRSISHQL